MGRQPRLGFKIETGFLRSKVARRIFVHYFVSSFVPILLLAALSFGQVRALLTHQEYESMRRATKSYGLALLDRLVMLDHEFRWIENRLANAVRGENPSLTDDHSAQGFTAIDLLNPAELRGSSVPLFRRLQGIIAQQGVFLAGGNSILISDARPGTSRVYLLRLVRPPGRAPALALGEIEFGFLFRDLESFSPNSQVCVLDEKNVPLLCSPSGDDIVPAQLEKVAVSTTGHFKLTDGSGQDYLYTYWSLFLEPNFAVNSWTIVSRAPASTVLESVTKFSLVFAVVIALALVIVGLLSVRQIRRSLVPLEQLLDGVHRITHGDFTRPVEVGSEDEFQKLADSVNQMARTIDKQFNTLSTLAEIDQLILSSLKIEDIVHVVLTRAREIIPHDQISMAVMRTDCQAIDYIANPNSYAGRILEPENLSIESEEIESLQHLPYRVSTLEGAPSPAYLEKLHRQGARYALILPVLVKDKLHALICLGYTDSSRLAQNDIARGRDLANRVAVALANAKWEEQLYYLAHYDSLTGLPNRLLLKDRLHQALASAERQRSFVAVLFIDLDRFKNVNDSLGHVTGDYLLREIAERLRRVLAEEDTASRIGGDEFVVVLVPGHDPLSQITATANRLLIELARPFVINDREIVTTASIGISCYPTDGETVVDLLRNADAAMYHAKDKGKNNYQFYSRILNDEALERLETENCLRHGLERDEFEIVYQPKYDAGTRLICGAEALLRWNHPERGRISPATFIPISEETGLIIPIGEWVVRNVCKQITAWAEEQVPIVRIAINLSPVQFRHPDLIERIVGILDEVGVDPGLLEFEITEGAAMENIAATTVTLNRFGSLGFHISIDDFGVGHSSLNYLKQFPLHSLKIDRSFVRNIGEDTKDEAIVKSIVTLAHSLDLNVVAEGVETMVQFEFLRELECEVIQGFLFSPPLSESQFTELLKRTPS